MRTKLFQMTALFAGLAFVASASALCPKDAKCGSKKGASTVSAKATEDGRSDATQTKSKAPCSFSGKKNAALTGTSSPCSGKCAGCPDCKKGDVKCGDCPKCKGAALASASPCGKDCKKPCCSKTAKTAAANAPCHAKGSKSLAKGECPIGNKVKAVLASLPTMKYKVGDEVTGCSHSAAAMAKDSGKTMQYVIGDESFDSKNKASARLVSLYDAEIKNLQSLQFAVGGDCFKCPVTAKGKAKTAGKKIAYRVGGFDFAEKNKAESALKLIASAIEDVKMTYKVGEKSFCCSKMASAKVKETGSTMSFVVGEDVTTDENAANIKLAESKIRTIIRTAAAAAGS